MKSPSNVLIEKFKKVVSNLDRISIVITQIDPDAIASARGLLSALRFVKPSVQVKTFFCGVVSHPQNRAIFNKFDLASKMVPISEMKTEDSACVSLVDSSALKDGRIPQNIVIDPVIVIDHHRGDSKQHDEKFIWVEDCGSASTMVAELLHGLGFQFDEANQNLATLLTVGIHTDTGGLINCGQRDREVFSFVSHFASNTDLNTLFNFPMPDSYYLNLSRALGSCIIKGGKLVASIGTISDPKAGDDLANLADMFIRRDGITLVVVWGIVDNENCKGNGDNKVVRISARNTDVSCDLGIFLRERLGAGCGSKLSETGKAQGGGMIELKLGNWLNPDTVAEIEALVAKWISSAIFPN